MRKKEQYLVLGHRGVCGTKIPENSAEAIKQAALWGFDGVEIDVQLTKDNQLVLWHDRELGGHMVHELTLQQAQSYVDYPLLLVEDMLDLVTTLQLYLMCEIKVYQDDVWQRLCTRLMPKLFEKMALNMLLVSSFSLACISYLQREWSKVHLAYASEIAKMPKDLDVGCMVHPYKLWPQSQVQSVVYEVGTLEDFQIKEHTDVFAVVVDRK